MKALTVLDARAAFVDVGGEHMHVSVAGDEPAVFGTVTSQLRALRDWLKAQGVRSVAMEATGVYWLPLYGMLEAGAQELRSASSAAAGKLQDVGSISYRRGQITVLDRPGLEARSCECYP